MRKEEEIRKWIEILEKERETKGPFTERENIARKAIKQALLWVLEEVDSAYILAKIIKDENSCGDKGLDVAEGEDSQNQLC